MQGSVRRLNGWPAMLVVGAMLAGTAVATASDYGVLDLTGRPPPQLVYDTPRLGQPAAAGQAPVYLHVPRDHGKRWSRHCAHYQACDRPAYFVSEEWFYGIYRGRALAPELDPEETLSPQAAGSPAAD